MEWISVKDRLPDEHEANNTRQCIVAIKNGWSQVSYYNSSLYDDFDIDDPEGFSYNNVTHWMPLPEPPKGE